MDEFEKTLGGKPLIMVENRTDQFISTGKEIAGFWQHLRDRLPNLMDRMDIVLDIQQLYTKTGYDFQRELSVIPSEAIAGLHIHRKHRVPSIADEIPWEHVFQRVATLGRDIILNPEIHHSAREKKRRRTLTYRTSRKIDQILRIVLRRLGILPTGSAIYVTTKSPSPKYLFTSLQVSIGLHSTRNNLVYGPLSPCGPPWNYSFYLHHNESPSGNNVQLTDTACSNSTQGEYSHGMLKQTMGSGCILLPVPESNG